MDFIVAFFLNGFGASSGDAEEREIELAPPVDQETRTQSTAVCVVA